MYFNPERKKDYILYEGNTKDTKSIEGVFKTFKKYEEEMNRDICEMHTEDILKILLENYSKTSGYSEKCRLEAYIEWCRAKNYCKVNWLAKKYCPKEKITALYKDKDDRYYLSEQKYNDYVKLISNYIDGAYDLSIFMAIYEGIAGEQYSNLIHLVKEDINVKNSTVRLYDGRNKKVSKDLIKALLNSYNTNVLNNKSLVMNLNNSLYADSIWKSNREITEAGMLRKFRDRLSKIKELLNDKDLNINNISGSGIFNYVVKRAQEDKYDIIDDMQVNGRNELILLNQKYQKYFDELQIKIKFHDFKDRYQTYVKYIKSPS